MGKHRFHTPHYSIRGEAHPQAKLTWIIVEDIRSAHKRGESARSLARRYDVSDANIGLIVRNVTWVDDAYTPRPAAR